MQKVTSEGDLGTVSEMAIVDTFTKLIFGTQEFSAIEGIIIRNFRAVEASVSHDNYTEMGVYLRNLGVREMIQLVTRLREFCNGTSGTQRILGKTRLQGSEHLRPGH